MALSHFLHKNIRKPD